MFKTSSILTEAQRFIAKLCDIPRLQARLESMCFRLYFHQEVPEISAQCDIIIRAIEQVMNSRILYQVVQSVLVIGNYLNGNSFRGNASGFQIGSLTTLGRAVSPRNKSESLLHHLARTLRSSGSSPTELSQEIKLCKSVGECIDINHLQKTINVLEKGLDATTLELKSCKTFKSIPQNDQFIAKLNEFIEQSQPVLLKITESAQSMIRHLDSLWDYFDEPENSDSRKSPHLFLGELYAFSEMLKAAGIEVEARLTDLSTSQGSAQRSLKLEGESYEEYSVNQ